jgi:hypothetical protein
VTEHKSIYAALAKAQIEMGPALKDSTNPAFRSKYADLSSVMAACLPALNKNGIAVIQPTIDEDGARYVKTVLAHESGETLECRVPLIVAKNDMQGYGSAVTYARRYGLMSMAGIAPEDDDGNAAAKSPPRDEPKPRGNGPSDAQIAHDRAVVDAHAMIESAESIADLQALWAGLSKPVQADPRVVAEKDKAKARLTPKPADLGGDDIPESMK